MGEFKRKYRLSSIEELAPFYQRAFTPGDRNYQAQFWYARFAVEFTDRDKAQKAEAIFLSLRKAGVSHDIRIKIRDYLGYPNAPKRVRGKLDRRAASYCLFRIPDLPMPALLHENDVEEDVWGLLETGCEATFVVGFSYSGLKCVDLELV